MTKKTIASLLLLIAPLSEGQYTPELLSPVAPMKAQRLIEYNSPWLQAELYSAMRFRIVTADTSLLLRDDDFTVTPFDDVTPIHLTQVGVQRWDDSVAWSALMLLDLPEIVEAAGVRPTVLLSMMAWATDEFGNAVVSSESRFDHAFYSVRATFELFPPVKYMLVPLKYTPKYSVIFEVDPDKDVLFIVDSPPEGQELGRSPADDARLRAYQDFLETLPPDRLMPVVEEVE